jgi:hypothetical protein
VSGEDAALSRVRWGQVEVEHTVALRIVLLDERLVNDAA